MELLEVHHSLNVCHLIQYTYWLQNSCSYFQIHSPPDISIHIRHASRTVQCQMATLQFIVFTSFCWTSHPLLNLCWQILFLLWSENLESITGTYQMCWINRHLQETLETSSVWTSLCIANNCIFIFGLVCIVKYFLFLFVKCLSTNFVFDQGAIHV